MVCYPAVAIFPAAKKISKSFLALWIFLGAADLSSSSVLAAEHTYTLEPIVIVPTKSQLLPCRSVRKVKVIDAETIAALPVHSVPELLTHVLGVDIRQRSALGVQADFNIRGANFDQVLICINGVSVSDPQTGHHNLDLPVTLMDIERIELLPGQGLSFYGPGAFGGTVNIVTKKPKGQGLEFAVTGGNFGFHGQDLSLNYPLGSFENRLTFSRKGSSGWRADTDFKTTALSLNAQRDYPCGSISYLFGYTDKDFGADSFYSNLYPHEEEHTDTRFFNLTAHINRELLELKTDFYFRRHADKFLLDRYRPAFYVNYHTSYAYGANLEALMNFAFGILALGSEVGWDKITSTRLGNHLRDRQALYIQLQSPQEKRTVGNFGLRLDHFQGWGWLASPNFNCGYAFTPVLRWKNAFGRAFRIPTFTDLYYQSPANIGNQDLTLEKAWSAETGLDYQKGGFSGELTFFSRWAEDLIGWVRATPAAAWQAQNIASAQTQGIELDLALKAQDEAAVCSGIYSGYAYQYTSGEEMATNTKYTLDALKHHAYLGLDLKLPGNFTQFLSLSYKERLRQRPYFLLDSRISKEIQRDGLTWEVFLDITNLLNTSYSEQSDIPLPGRWVIGGVRIKL